MYFLNKSGKKIKSKIIAIKADIKTIKDNWLIDLNSEKSKGNKDITITTVVLIIALKVIDWQYAIASLDDLPFFLAKL